MHAGLRQTARAVGNTAEQAGTHEREMDIVAEEVSIWAGLTLWADLQPPRQIRPRRSEDNRKGELAVTGVGLVFSPPRLVHHFRSSRARRYFLHWDQIVRRLLDLAEFREYRPRLVEEHELARPHVFVPCAKQHVTSPTWLPRGAIAAADLVLQGRERSLCPWCSPSHDSMRFVHGARGSLFVNNEAVGGAHLSQARAQD